MGRITTDQDSKRRMATAAERRLRVQEEMRRAVSAPAGQAHPPSSPAALPATDIPGGPVELVTLYTRILRILQENPRMAQETLARRLGVTMRTTQRHLVALERDGYVVVNRLRKPYSYTIQMDQVVLGLPGWAVKHLLTQPPWVDQQ